MHEQDALDALVAGAGRWDDADLAADPALRPVLDDLCADLMAAASPRRRFRLRLSLTGSRGMLAAALATAVVILAVPAIGRLTADDHRPSAQHPFPPGTVWERPGGGVQLVPQTPQTPGGWEMRGEVAWVNLAGGAYPYLLNDLGRVFPLPPGGGWPYLAAHPPGSGWIQADDLGRSMVRNAVCEWEYYWLDRMAGQDGDRASAAWRGLRQVSAWTFVTPDGRGGHRTTTVVYGAVRPDPPLVRQDVADFCHPQMWSRPQEPGTTAARPGATA